MATVKHLKVLGRKANPDALHNAAHLSKLVEDIVESVGMTLLGIPTVHDVDLDIAKLGREPFEDEGGTSVQAAGCYLVHGCLSTSHVALHGWPLRGEYHLDIYSCRAFEDVPVIELLAERLDGKMQWTDLTFALAWLDGFEGPRDNGDGGESSSPTF